MREPVTNAFSSPFIASRMTVLPDWIDYNGHLNMAYYNVLFDRSVDELFDALGIGRAYLAATQRSVFVVEAHVRYLREIGANDTVRSHMLLIDFDDKRLHLHAELRHADDGWLSATSETMSLHVDMATRKTTPFPPAATGRLRALKVAQDRLPRPEGIGRRIAMPKR